MDNAHGHPAPPATVPNRRQTIHTYHATPRSTSTGNRQQRLLRSRNARFPAKKLSITGLSARFSQLIRSGEEDQRKAATSLRNQENTVNKRHRSHESASTLSPSLGILEEIGNTLSGRDRVARKRKPIPIFQDTPERALLSRSPSISPPQYNELSSLVNSPAQFDHIQDSLHDMGLREISGNARKSLTPDSPPYVGSMRAGRQRKSNQKSQFNSEEYIEHIERELELVKDAVYSPNSNRPWKEKLKVAKAENERLRRDIAELRTGFESEVQQTVEHMTATEADLRRKIRSLEDEMERKQYAIHDLECQHEEKRLDQSTVDNLKATIERLEQEKLNLEQDNESMSRRNDVLTQLLALSPTKSQHFELGTPLRIKNGGRPKSLMLPRILSSPGTHTLSHPQSLATSPAASTSDMSPQQYSPVRAMCHDRKAPKSLSDSISVDASLNDAVSMRSDIPASSRRSTLDSQASHNTSTSGLSHRATFSLDQHTAKQPHKRRARRFMPGSTQLKPLLLPTLTGDYNTTSPITSPRHGTTRDFSEVSLDPTTQFLSKSPTSMSKTEYPFPLSNAGSPLGQSQTSSSYQTFEDALGLIETDSPSRLLHRNSALHALENDFNGQDANDSGQHEQRLEAAEAWGTSPLRLEDDNDRTVLPSPAAIFSHLRSCSSPVLLHGDGGATIDEINTSPLRSPTPVEVPQPLFSPFARRRVSSYAGNDGEHAQLEDYFQESYIEAQESSSSRKRRKISSSSGISQGDYEAELTSQIPALQARPLSPNPDPDYAVRSRPPSLTLRSPRARSPFEMLQQRNIAARPLAAVTIKTIYGTLSRYTTYIRYFKKDPLALARRVMANAWRMNWKVMGRLSWWVLGLFLGSSRTAERSQAWDWDDYDGEAIADRHCRRRSREIMSEEQISLLSPGRERHVRFEEQHAEYRTRGSRSPARPALKSTKPGWGKSVLLWGKFSVAILMAVGGAVVKGPGEMLKEVDEPRKSADSAFGRQRYQSRDIPATPSTGSGKRLGVNTAGLALDQQRYKDRDKGLSSPDSSSASLEHIADNDGLPPWPVGSPPPFRFGDHQSHSFDIYPRREHRLELEVGFDDGADETLRPPKQNRPDLVDVFAFPPPAGNQEYDPESAGFGIFSPLSLRGSDHGEPDVGQFEDDFG